VKLWSIAVPAATVLVGIVAASFVSPEATALFTGAAAALAGFGWPYLLGVPARKSQGLVLALVGAGGVAAAYFAPATAMLTWLPGIVAVGVGAVFLIQLLRGTGQPHRLESTIGVIAGALVAGMAAGWVAADRLPGGGSESLIISGVAAIAVAMLISLIPLADRITAPVGVIAGALAAAGAAALVPGLPLLAAAFVGALCAAVIVAVRRLVLIRDDSPGLLGILAAGAFPVLSLGTAVYFAGRLLVP